MSDLLRVYRPVECGADGYPFAWYRETAADGVGLRLPPNLLAPEDLALPRSPAIKDYVRELAGHRCVRCGHPYRSGQHGDGEWSPCDERCEHDGPVRDDIDVAPSDWHPTMPQPQRYAQWRILTVHHLNGIKYDCRWWNLAALCQRCHLSIQGRVFMDRAFMFEHSDWFKPYAAGFYAWKYQNEDLTREETLARLDDLLALERLA